MTRTQSDEFAINHRLGVRAKPAACSLTSPQAAQPNEREPGTPGKKPGPAMATIDSAATRLPRPTRDESRGRSAGDACLPENGAAIGLRTPRGNRCQRARAAPLVRFAANRGERLTATATPSRQTPYTTTSSGRPTSASQKQSEVRPDYCYYQSAERSVCSAARSTQMQSSKRLPTSFVRSELTPRTSSNCPF